MITKPGTERSMATLGPVIQGSPEPAQKLDSKCQSQTEAEPGGQDGLEG